MATTLPTFQKTIDNQFTTTWYEVRPDAADNVTLATAVWALLKLKGCFKTQVGGNTIERTVKYALPTTQNVDKGDVFNQGELENRTAAFWNYRRHTATSIQRSVFDDVANAGKFQIINYVTDRLEDASEALKQAYELAIVAAEVTDESGKAPQSLNDMIPTVTNRATGTYGNIARPTTFASDVATVGNTWWTPKYYALTANPEINLLTDFKKAYNQVGLNQEYPDAVLSSQTLFEIYEEFGLDATQIIGNQKLLDLGFQTLKFKGMDWVWTPNMTSANSLGGSYGDAMFLNTRWIEVIYDPNMWFDMTPWKDIPLQGERVAQILCKLNMVCRQLRRHMRIYG